MAMVRDEAKVEILDCGVLEQCLSHIEKYPDDDIDHDILSLSLDLISQSVSTISHFTLSSL